MPGTLLCKWKAKYSRVCLAQPSGLWCPPPVLGKMSVQSGQGEKDQRFPAQFSVTCMVLADVTQEICVWFLQQFVFFFPRRD